ncbi:MAG: hypothetical protein P8I97_00195, partial [Verrucomicrobiales bacterium]|nr:hypothetical protein [Verrucomicrobiales bacterium]
MNRFQADAFIESYAPHSLSVNSPHPKLARWRIPKPKFSGKAVFLSLKVIYRWIPEIVRVLDPVPRKPANKRQ